MDEQVQERQQRFLKHFLPNRERLWRFVRALTHASRDTVDEIMSETVFRVYQRFEHVRDEQAFRAYCFQVARRVAWDMAKKARRQYPTDPTELPDLHSDSPQPDTAADVSLLHELLTELSPKLRETLVLFEIADLSLEDIREIQGGTLSGVKSRLVRARSQLAEILRKEELRAVQAETRSSQLSRTQDHDSELYEVHPEILGPGKLPSTLS